MMLSTLLSSVLSWKFMLVVCVVVLAIIPAIRLFYWLTVKLAGPSRLDGQRPHYCIVTGSNAGIGFKTAQIMLERGYHVIMAVRSIPRGEAARKLILEEVNTEGTKFNERLVVMQCDLSDLNSVSKFAKSYIGRFKYLDVLINNAGLLGPIKNVTKQGYELTYGVCYLGHVLLTEKLIPALKASPSKRKPRIVALTSVLHKKVESDWTKSFWKERTRMDSWPEEHLGLGIPATSSQYSYVKLLNAIYAKILHERLYDNHQIIANAAHPGIISSSISRQYTNGFIQWIMDQIFLSPRQGSQTSVHCACADEVEELKQSGRYWADRRIQAHNPLMDDKDFRKAIWEQTLEYLDGFLAQEEVVGEL